MKRPKKILLFIVAGICLVSSTAVVFASSNAAPDWLQKADEWVEQKIKEKSDANGIKPIATASETGYSLYLNKAKNQEQKDAISKLQKDTSLGWGEWKRNSLQIIGELPANARRLKLEEARRIINEKTDTKAITSAFNEIAGAPDWEGGSGIHRVIYYLDDARKEGIYILNGTSILHVTKDENGVEKAVSLRDGEQAPEPKPTQRPASQ